MMVPGVRLLWLAGTVMLPGCVLVGLGGAWAPAGAGLLALGVLASLVDLVRSRHDLAAVEVGLPGLVRLARERPGALPLRVSFGDTPVRQVRVGLRLPGFLHGRTDPLAVDRPAGSHEASAAWTCRPTRRGRIVVDTVFVEADSRAGLWTLRMPQPVTCEVRIYPNLMADRKAAAAVFLNRGLGGIRVRRRVGRGRDFEQLRDYIHGDGFDEIHWRATAKRGTPVTKVFQVERTQEVVVAVDVSRLSARPARLAEPGHDPATMLERYIAAALLIGRAAERQGDRFGLLTFSHQVHTFVPARSGRGHYTACLDALYTAQPTRHSPDFHELFRVLGTRLRRRSLVILLTSMDDEALTEQLTHRLLVAARRHLLLVASLPPVGVEPAFARPDAGDLADVYNRFAGHLLWRRIRAAGQDLHARGAQFLLLDDERIGTQLISQYLEVKQRQLL